MGEPLASSLEESTLFGVAYLILLRLPHGACRARSQALLAGMRDEIARLTGLAPEDIQNQYELTAANFILQATNGSLS